MSQNKKSRPKNPSSVITPERSDLRATEGNPKIKQSAKSQSEKGEGSWPQYVYWLIPVVLTAIVHFNGIQNGFVNLDDELYILNNTWITSLSSENLKLMFTEYLGGNYHPLVHLNNAIEYAIAGKHDPTIYHLFNYAYHLINTFLVFVLIRKLTARNAIIACTVAVLFGIHPLHVESVAWISERKDVLYSLFFLLSSIYYLNFRQSGRSIHFVLSLVLFVLSCLSKSMAVTLPLVLVLFDYYLSPDGEKWNWKIMTNKIPFFIVSLIFGMIALKSQAAQGYIADYHFNVLEKFVIAVYSVAWYVIHLFVPYGLSCLHPQPVKGIGMEYYLALLILPILFLAWWKSGPYKKLVSFGFLFFFTTIILVLQFISIGGAVVSERYTYIPYIGLFLILAQLGYDVYKGGLPSLHSLKNLVLPISCIIVFIFSFLSFQRNKVWKDGVSLWRDCTSTYPETADYGWYGLGNILKEKYDKYDANKGEDPKPTKEEIINAYDNAIRINPNFPNYYLNSSSARSAFGDKKGAMQQLDKAISIQPDNALCLYNRGVLKTELNDHQGALLDYSAALKKDPGYWQAYFNRAIAHKNLNQYQPAVEDYLKVISLNPGYIFAYNNLGNVYYAMTQYESAIVQYNKALEFDPKQSNTLKNRGAAKLSLNRKAEACVDFETSMKLGDPEGKYAYESICK